jgi:hypothetical protein
MQRKSASMHKSTSGNRKLPAAERAFVLIPPGDRIIPGAAAVGAGKALGPADTKQGIFTGFLVHTVQYIPKILSVQSFNTCNNLTNSKKGGISVYFSFFSKKHLDFYTSISDNR